MSASTEQPKSTYTLYFETPIETCCEFDLKPFIKREVQSAKKLSPERTIEATWHFKRVENNFHVFETNSLLNENEAQKLGKRAAESIHSDLCLVAKEYDPYYIKPILNYKIVKS